MRDSLLDIGKEDQALQGVVLLDLPDHDSTEVSHHLEVDRLIELTDLMVWVLDPQKYADAAVHDRYLTPLSTHWAVMMVVLNHVDEVPDDRRQSMLDDIRRLLDADGLERVPLLATSATHGRGHGRPALRHRRPGPRQAGHPVAAGGRPPQARRSSCSDATGTGRYPELSKARIGALEDAFADAAGVPPAGRGRRGRDPHPRPPRHRLAGDLVGVPAAARPAQAAPPRPRQGRGLGLHRPAPHVLPAPTQVQRARVDSEVRLIADEVTGSAVTAVGRCRTPGLPVPASRAR